MKKTAQVVVTGPLAPYAAGYRRDLSDQGYSAWTAVSYLYSLARVSRWLAGHGLTAADLDGECVERFLAERPASRRSAVQRRTPRGMMSLLGHLRALGVAPALATAKGTAADALLNEFAGFLRNERGLAKKTVCVYRRVAGLFLSSQLGDGVDVRALSAGHVNAFVLA